MTDVTSKANHGANALLGLIGLLSLQQWALLIGVILSVGTFFINVWYRKKMVEITQSHQKEIRDIQRNRDDHH